VNPDAVIAGAAIVQVDERLLEADTGEVDWAQLDAKTKTIVGAIFGGLG
jgi:hypothetical protein